MRLTPNCATSSASDGICAPGDQRPASSASFRYCLTRAYGGCGVERCVPALTGAPAASVSCEARGACAAGWADDVRRRERVVDGMVRILLAQGCLDK